MRLLVGTLHTIENEFEECITSIKEQRYQNFEHVILKNIPNKEAHDTLYKTFMERADEFDLFIKVDADMVIENKNLFSGIVYKFRKNPLMKDLEIAVYDFFSEQLIWGMHTYRNNVKWQKNEENLFVDSCPVLPEEKIYDDSDLAPAAIHCKNPSLFQAFHYGVHKALKIIQPGRKNIRKEYTFYHWNILEKMHQHFNRTCDKRVGMAVLGAELTFRGGIYPEHISYTNPLIKKKFQAVATITSEELKSKISSLKIQNFGYLPSKLRRKLVLSYASIRIHFDKRINNKNSPSV